VSQDNVKEVIATYVKGTRSTTGTTCTPSTCGPCPELEEEEPRPVPLRGRAFSGIVIWRRGGRHQSAQAEQHPQVLNLIREHETAAVAELAPKSRLSKTTVKKMIDLLVSLGLVQSAGKGLSTDEGGKKPELFRFNPAYGYVIGIHVTPRRSWRRPAT